MARRRNEDQEEQGRFYISEMEEMPDEERYEQADGDEGGPVPTADGGLVLALGAESSMDEPEQTAALAVFDGNLAALLSSTQQTGLGMRLKEYVEVDLESRQDWAQRMLDGLEIIGLKDIPESAVAFSGAARVNYPGLIEAMVQFQARAMEELMPPEGPVKVGVLGEPSEELEAQAQRVQDYMNYQLMEEDDEYYNETDCMLFELPYAGSVFKKVAIDPVTGRTRSRLVTALDFIVPYRATSLKTAPRYTHRYTMPINIYRRAAARGYYIEAEFPQGQPTDDGEGRKLADVSDDRTASDHPDDQELLLYEMTIDWEFTEFTDPFAAGKTYHLPYAITFEHDTGRVVRIARVWEETDTNCEKDVWYTHFKLLPGFGFYGIGYLHVIGGLGRAASGALRLLLDGSATASLQGGFKSQDAKIAGDVVFEPATWKDVDMSAEELAKSFYSPPFKEPSPALFKTLEILVNGLQRFTSTTEAMIGDAKNTGPVGTTVALIEQGSKVFSGIHKRIHAAARQEFKLIAKSNFRFMAQEQYPFQTAGGERSVFRDDFGPQIDVVPVSDPNIFSSTQRIALAQAGLQLAETQPALYGDAGLRKAHRTMLKALRIPDADEWLPEKNVKRMDPVSENQAVLNQLPIQAFPEQDDEAHMAVHSAFEQEVLGMDPEIAQQAVPILKAHKAEHFAQMYRKRLEQQVMSQYGVPLPPFDPRAPEDYEELPPDIEAAVARAAAGYAPPPPPPAPEQAGEDQAAVAEQDRLDMIAQREEDRKDAAHVAQLKREGSISDLPDGAFGM